MQYPVIYAAFSRLNRNSFSRYRASLADSYTDGRKKSEVRSQKIDDLPVLATRRSGTSAMLSSKVNGPVAHGSTRKCLIWLTDAFDYSNVDISSVSFVHFQCGRHSFSGPSLHMAYYRTP